MTAVVLTITQVARRLGISTRTIRVYEAEGFIRLQRSGNRCFLGHEDVDAILRIERLRADLSVNLHGVGVILEMRRKMLDLQERMNRMEEEFERRLNEALEQGRQDRERSLAPRGPRSLTDRGPRSLVKIDSEE